jgi:hypothetical protein
MLTICLRDAPPTYGRQVPSSLKDHQKVLKKYSSTSRHSACLNMVSESIDYSHSMSSSAAPGTPCLSYKRTGCLEKDPPS